MVTAVVMGSLLASHMLLGMSIVKKVAHSSRVCQTVNAGGERLIDEKILDVVFVLILITATIGPIMTQHYAPLMLPSSEDRMQKKTA